uniref:Amino acid transporter n=1 Tax=Poecilia reticulata TaxID=8081 RepID=A0A3P9PCC7_POERE
MLPNSENMSEVELVEVARPEDNEKNERCSQPLDEVESIRDGFNIWIFLKRNAFLILTMAAVALGIGLGFALRYINMSEREITYLTFPGELLLRMLKMMVLPLVVSSIIAGISNVDRKDFGKIGLRIIIYYLVTTVVATFTGIFLAVFIKPGKSSRHASESSPAKTEDVHSLDAFLDLIRNMFPSNLVEACFRKVTTNISTNSESCCYESVIVMILSCHILLILLLPLLLLYVLLLFDCVDYLDCFICCLAPIAGTSDGINVVGLLVFSIAFGLILSSMGSEGKPLRDLFNCMNKAIMRLVSIVICSATLPVTLRCMEENLKMDKQVTRFMLPVGATMNMDGSALYEAVAALFIAQVNDMDFNFGQIIVLSLVVTAASTGAPGIPQAGMVTMLIVLSSTGLPTEDISLLLMVDWILDRLRTATNVLGDCIGVGVVQHLSRHELQTSSPTETNLVLEENPPSKSISTKME